MYYIQLPPSNLLYAEYRRLPHIHDITDIRKSVFVEICFVSIMPNLRYRCIGLIQNGKLFTMPLLHSDLHDILRAAHQIFTGSLTDFRLINRYFSRDVWRLRGGEVCSIYTGNGGNLLCSWRDVTLNWISLY